MKTLGCKVSDDLYSTFQTFCRSRERNINEVLTNLVEQTLEGKMKPRPTGLESRIPFCPECGFVLFPRFGEGTLNCLRCGFYSRTSGPKKWQRGEFEIG